jgi:uncharacterized protein (TIGR02001 family)
MKRITIILALLPFAAFARIEDRPVHEGEIPWTLSSTLTLTSEYMDRGVSASDEQPTLQSEFILTHDSGAYVGTWLSGIDYNDNETNIELDYFAGYGAELGDGWWWDSYIIRYTFPGVDDTLNYDFFEITGKLGYTNDFGEVAASLYYSPDNFADSGDFWYPNLAAKIPLAHGFYTSGEAGYLVIDDEVRYASPDYAHWRLGIGYVYDEVDLRLDYHDADLSEAECPDLCGPRVVFSVSRSF